MLFGRSAAQTALEETRLARLERIAQDLGISIDDLSSITIEAHYTSDLLRLRMSLLHLDQSDAAVIDPNLLESLQTSCKQCAVKGQCAADIIEDAANPRWQAYCPNAMKLCTMRAQSIEATV